MVAEGRRNCLEIKIFQTFDRGNQVWNTDLHETQRRGALRSIYLRMLRARLGRRQLEAHPKPINLRRNISPACLDHDLRIAAQKVDRSSSGTAGAIGAENSLAPIGIAVAEPYAVDRDALERKRAVGSNPTPSVTQPAYEIGLAIEAPDPGSDTKHKIVSGTLELVKLRPHGTTPMTTTQLASSLLLPAASRAVTK